MVQRQDGDDQSQFRQALQELREVKLSIPSWDLLSIRVQAKLTQSEIDSFSAALRVCSTNARVREYNYEHMMHVNAPQVEAKNQGKRRGAGAKRQCWKSTQQVPRCEGRQGNAHDQFMAVSWPG